MISNMISFIFEISIQKNNVGRKLLNICIKSMIWLLYFMLEHFFVTCIFQYFLELHQDIKYVYNVYTYIYIICNQ